MHNPYGTPTSLSVISPQYPPSFSRIDDSVPNSPSVRQALATSLDRDFKSSSPEIRISAEKNSPENAITTALAPSQSGDLQNGNSELDAGFHELAENREHRRFESGNGNDGEGSGDAFKGSAETPRDIPTSLQDNHIGSPIKSRSHQLLRADVDDPVESDSESFDGTHRSMSANRPRLSKTPTRPLLLSNATLTDLSTTSRTQPVGRKPDYSEQNAKEALPHQIRSVRDRDDGDNQKSRAQQAKTAPAQNSLQNTLDKVKPKTSAEAGQDLPPESEREIDDSGKKSGASQASEGSQRPSQATTSDSQNIEISNNDGLSGPEEQPAAQPKDHSTIAPASRTSNEENVDTEKEFADLEAERILEETGKLETMAVEADKEKTEKARTAAIEAEERRSETLDRANIGKDRADHVAKQERLKAKAGSRVQAQQVGEARAKEEEHARAKYSQGKNEKRKGMFQRAVEEDAKKSKISSDGAKRLQTEMTKAKKTPETPKAETTFAPKLSVADGASQKQQPSFKVWGPRAGSNGANAIEERTSTESKKNGPEAENLQKVVEPGIRLVTEKEKAVNTRSNSPNLRSSSPINSSGTSDRNRRSMTPALPRSMAIRPSSRGDPPSSSPLSSKSGNMDPPLRSALSKKLPGSAPSSAIRRSVSFVSDHSAKAPQSHISSNVPIVRPVTKTVYNMESLNSLRNINNELRAHTPSKPQGQTSARPTNFSISKMTPAKKQTKKPATSKRKFQSTLNVTRDAKLKGKAVQPHSSPLKEAIVVSADRDDESFSSYYEGEDVEARAGPSSRNKASSSVSSQSKSSVARGEEISVLDPELSQSQTDGKLSSSLRSSVASAAVSEPASKSKFDPPKSSSSSDTESDDSLDFDSKSTPRKSSTTDSNQANANVSVNGYQTKHATPSLSTSSRLHPASAKTGGARSIDQAAKRQLQRESLASTSNVSARKPAASIWDMPDSDDLKFNTNVGITGGLPSGMRPANFKYPKISEMKNAAAEKTSSSRPRKAVSDTHPAAGNSKQNALPTAQEESGNTSESDDSDESSVDSLIMPKGTPKNHSTVSRVTSVVKGLFFPTSSA